MSQINQLLEKAFHQFHYTYEKREDDIMTLYLKTELDEQETFLIHIVPQENQMILIGLLPLTVSFDHSENRHLLDRLVMKMNQDTFHNISAGKNYAYTDEGEVYLNARYSYEELRNPVEIKEIIATSLKAMERMQIVLTLVFKNGMDANQVVRAIKLKQSL